MAHQPAVENLVRLIQKCRQHKKLPQALKLLAYMRQHHLHSHRTLGNYLVPTLVDCGSLPDAQQVFDALDFRNEVSWSSLISGYVGCREFVQAFHFYHKMLEDAVYPSDYTFVALLGACSTCEVLARGQAVHAEIVKWGSDSNLFVCNTLVDMYAKCGMSAEACQVFNNLPARDAISWNALISGCTEFGLGKQALDYFDQMRLDGFTPDAVSIVCSLKACAMIVATEKGQLLFADVIKRGLETDLFVGSTIVDMFGKCGLLTDAHYVFRQLPVRNVVTWTALLSAYAESGLGDEALNFFKQMYQDGIPPNAKTFTCTLKACGSTRALETGRQVHAELIKGDLEREVQVGNALVDMYAKSGSLPEAWEVFQGMAVRDVVSWAAVMSGYVEHGCAEEVLKCAEEMQVKGMPSSVVTFLCCLKACGSLQACETAKSFHIEILSKGLENDVSIGTALVSMYGKCGLLLEARTIFDDLPLQHAVSWNVLIAGYAEHGFGEEALKCFEQMQLKGISPDDVTFACCLKASAVIGVSEQSWHLCADITKKGLDRHLHIGSTMSVMFAKCGCLAEACKVTNALPVQDAVSWNTLIAGYLEQGLGEDALNCFHQMKIEGVHANIATFVASLKACSSTGSIETGQQIHTVLLKKGFDKELCLGNALVDMYSECYLLADAQCVFDKLLVRDAASWASLISGYADCGHDKEVLNRSKQMLLTGVTTDTFTFVRCLKACGNEGALETGQKIHTEVRKLGLENDLFVGNSLIDMYGKCGSLVEGQQVFGNLMNRDVVSWGAMIKAYAENHEAEMAIHCFEAMQEQGIKPDPIIFTCLLAACSHASLVIKGQEYFKAMIEHGIEPTLDHLTCMIDMLARSGNLFEAERFADAMLCFSSKEVLTALLSACKIYGKVDMLPATY